MSRTSRIHVTIWKGGTAGARACAVVVLATAAALATQGNAMAAVPSRPVPSAAAPASRAFSASICKNVSAASVSAIVGYSVPAPKFSSYKEPASKKNFDISAVTGACTYGSESSAAALKKVVILEVETISKPLTASEEKAEIESVDTESASIHFKIVPYTGLGGTAFYFSFTEDGYSAQGVTDFNGTAGFGASVESKTLAMSKVGDLAKLASKL